MSPAKRSSSIPFDFGMLETVKRCNYIIRYILHTNDTNWPIEGASMDFSAKKPRKHSVCETLGTTINSPQKDCNF